MHKIRLPGPGSYDAEIDAAVLSKPAGARPEEGLRGARLGPEGPASIHCARAALNRDGAVIGYVFESRAFSRVDIDTNESYSLAGPAGPLQRHDLGAQIHRRS